MTGNDLRVFSKQPKTQIYFIYRDVKRRQEIYKSAVRSDDEASEDCWAFFSLSYIS